MRKVVGGHRCQVCTKDGCTLVNTIVTFNLVFLNEVTNTNDYIAINAWVMERNSNFRTKTGATKVRPSLLAPL